MFTSSPKPAITIVTPSYNRAWAIRSCIESLRQQAGVNYEHLIIDGGSTDGTLEILRDAAATDDRIRFVSEPDAGMYDAVNKGMRMASAEVVAYLNTDDFYLPGALALVLGTFDKQPAASMLYGHWMSWHPENSFLEILPVLRYTTVDLTMFAVLPQPSVFFRRSVFQVVGGFDLSYQLLADNDFFSRAATAGFACIRIDAYLSAQTVHSGNLLAGNSAAISQAHAEGERYRHARRTELARSNPSRARYLSYSVSACKKALLPFIWRINLLRCIGLGRNAKTALAPWRMVNRNWSKLRLLQYLVSRAPRQKYPFLTIQPDDFAAFLGFLPPLPPSSPKYSHSGQRT